MSVLSGDPRVLTRVQRQVLSAAARAEEQYGEVGLHLEGGTALSAYYLGHRESEDLDLFGEAPLHAGAFSEVLAQILRSDGHAVNEVSAGQGFSELDAAGLRVHVARTSPHRLEERVATEEGLRVASFRDLAAGKLHAVCDRFEVRDFIDVHAILIRPEEDGGSPTGEVVGNRARELVLDLMEIDPGLNPSSVGQALARGLARPLIGTFPLRLLIDFSEPEIQSTLEIALDVCARLTRERMTENEGESS